MAGRLRWSDARGGLGSVAVSVLFIAGCGSQVVDQGDSGSPISNPALPEGGEPSLTTTDQISMPPSSGLAPLATLDSDTPPPSIELTLPTNDNKPDDAIGAVCWAQFEISLFYIALLQADVLGGGQRDLPDRFVMLDRAEAALQQFMADVDASEFGGHLLSQIRASRNAASMEEARTTQEHMDVGLEYFEFEKYPGVEEFARQAAESSNCTNF